jgi:glycosyltransferase involved in cell wall biosynthesis
MNIYPPMKTLIIGSDFQSIGSLKTQGQFLRDVLTRQGLNVSIASGHRNYLSRTFDTIFQLLRLKKRDTIIVQVFSTRGIYLECLSVLLGRFKRCKVISTLHGGNIPHVYEHHRIKRFLLNLIFNYSHLVTAPSSFIPKQIPALAHRHLIIRNIIELDAYHAAPKIDDGTIRIFWMRAYHTIYDPMKAIQVVEYLLAQNQAVKMVMAGSDLGLKNELQQYVESRECSKHITFLGVIDNDQKNEIASKSTVYLGTNTIDNAPVSFLEMMAMGLPIVSTNIGGIPYYVTHKKTALLSSDNSAADLANLILQLHHDNNLQSILITNGQTFIREFSADTVGRQWITLITQPLPS